MELRQLQYFIACADEKSFSKAALSLYTSQSNISKTIAALEKEVGQKLFDRKQHGIELTERGKQVYKYAKSAIEISDKILYNSEPQYSGELSVSFQPNPWFGEAFCQYYLSEKDKNIHYNLMSAPADEVIKRISSNIDQLGFIYLEERQLKKLEDAFSVNHIGHITIDKTQNVVYCGRNSENLPLQDMHLIQDFEGPYSRVSVLDEPRPKVMITTNSDNIMNIMLKRTGLNHIGPNYSDNFLDAFNGDVLALRGYSQNILLICIFKNDKAMEALPKKFLSFLKLYVKK